MTLRCLCLCVLLVAAPAAQVDPPQALEAQRQQLLEQLAEGGVRVDLEQQTIRVAAEVVRVGDPLEYFLIHRQGKSHEALFVTEVKPSLLNSAFLLLGFENGSNAEVVPVEPPPSEAEIEAGARVFDVVPPKGQPLWITVSWQDGERRVEHSADELIVDLTTDAALAEGEWIYLGGRLAALYRGDPPVFVADYEGNLISICYLMPANHLATLRHARADDDQNWWRTELCPPVGTAVEICFRRQPPAEANREPAPAAEADKKRG